jgi:hypothetical protein
LYRSLSIRYLKDKEVATNSKHEKMEVLQPISGLSATDYSYSALVRLSADSKQQF